MNIKKTRVFLTILLPVQVIVVQFLSTKSEFIEHYYAGLLYPVISKILRFLLGWLPFSFGDVLGVFLLILLIKGIYKLVKAKFKTWKISSIKLLSTLSILYFCFYFFWGLNYFREPLAKKLNIPQSEYTNNELIKTTDVIINQINQLHYKITKNDSLLVEVPYTEKEIYVRAKNGYDKLAKKHPEFGYKNTSVKSSLVSLLQSYNGTSGYINPITNEAQVNNMIPKTGMPATTCHEISHQIGWAAENEANFIGFLTAIENDDIYFNYSGYRMALNYCLRELRKRDKQLYNKAIQKINSGILKDYNAAYKHWKKFKNPIEPYIKKGYNSYLKANNQQNGVKSYNYVVDLLIGFYKLNK